jgi:cardiolipin synthase
MLAGTLAGVLLTIIVVLALVIWSIRRHRDPNLKIECDVGIDSLMPTLAGLTLGTVVDGNAVEVLENGKCWDAMIERIGSAEGSVHYGTFLWKEGELGGRMAAAFAERARAGVAVRIMLDGNGSRGIGKGEHQAMEKAGARVVMFHEMKLHNSGVMNDRTHRKMLIVDGREAFVGGHCVVDQWLGDAEDGQRFGDVSVHLRGPIVHSVQGAFSENWAGETGELFAGPACFPPLEPAGDVPMHLVTRSRRTPRRPSRSSTTPRSASPASASGSRTRTSSRARCDRRVRRGGEARRRRARADASTSGSDNPMVQHAGHPQLREADAQRRAPVRVPAHAAAPEGDDRRRHLQRGRLANFDDRSFETNDEVTVGILDESIAQRSTRSSSVRGAGHGDRPGEMERRGLWHKLKDQAAYSINELL